MVWILGAFAIQNGGYRIRTEVQRSAILQRLNTVLPPSGPLLNSLRRLDPFPRIQGPDGRCGGAARRHRARPGGPGGGRDVVKILGSACGLGVAGSGWVAGPDTVVTNAHVVAGEEDTEVLLGGREPGGRRRPSTSIRATTSRSCACPGSAPTALPLAGEPESGTSAAILGFPLNGPFDVRPGGSGRRSG